MSDIIDVEPERVLAAEGEGEKSTALPAVSGRRPLPIVPRSLPESMAIATTLHCSGLAPKALQTAERAAFAILSGAEDGLPPIAALRSILLVHGVATLWGGEGCSAVGVSTPRREACSRSARTAAKRSGRARRSSLSG